MSDEINPVTGLPWVGPKQRKPEERERDVVEGGAAEEGELRPAPLSDADGRGPQAGNESLSRQAIPLPPAVSDDESGPEPPQVRETRTESAKRDTKGFVEPRAQPPWETAAKLGGIVYPGRSSPPTGTVMFDGKGWPIVRNCAWDEETYVQNEITITRRQMESGKLKDVIDSRDGTNRMQRSERYARWRYRGFLAGQIAAL